MNTDLVLMFGALILLAISGLLVFCFTESKGKNTPHARGGDNERPANAQQKPQGGEQGSVVSHQA